MRPYDRTCYMHCFTAFISWSWYALSCSCICLSSFSSCSIVVVFFTSGSSCPIGTNSGELIFAVLSVCGFPSFLIRAVLVFYTFVSSSDGMLFSYVFFPPGKWAEHTTLKGFGLHSPLVFNSVSLIFGYAMVKNVKQVLMTTFSIE